MSPSRSNRIPWPTWIPATAFAGDHDAVRVDAERLGVGMDPPNRRNTIVQTGRELADLPRRRRHDRIVEVDGDDDRALTAIIRLKAR